MVAPNAWPDGKDMPPGVGDTGSVNAGTGAAHKGFQRHPERGAAEHRDEQPRRVTPFAANQVYHCDQPENDPEDIRIEDIANGLGRPDEAGMGAVDPLRRLRGIRVEVAKRGPPRPDQQKQQDKRRRGSEHADDTGAQPQSEPLVGGGKVVVEGSPRPPRHMV